jgi:hypothetical protein
MSPQIRSSAFGEQFRFGRSKAGEPLMIRTFKRYLAIRSYMIGLGGELWRRFGKKIYYSIENVTQAVKRGGFSPEFIEYAHAAYCTEKDFKAHYPKRVTCSYQDLRNTIAKRYFSGSSDFDGKTIISRFCRIRFDSAGFYESGRGFDQ